MTDLVPTGEMGRHLVVVVVSHAAQVDDPVDARSVGGIAEVRRRSLVGLFEVVGRPHRVHEVVRRRAACEGAVE